ncbi:RIP metalloprotease RseP [Convivina intestini]|uniref:Zinc metalloprotease n=1 Tax=Convivina intestini TaxID=1505726 RepID=A0A2U1DC15_9LACO|nr:RIP metalloprotease RseP [Convivina intestini]PVY85207.1 regulator of sigma E protease [Convivina intestini]CAH1852425.1 Regulator of sigma-W protease RasP [Convivina intestini]CAH1854585.1 Regulator of sigma-W protease RasP [Convivina intestini]SDC00715.1 regulator of sigma E protease [Leuconostocaceae bacterium R-53105]
MSFTTIIAFIFVFGILVTVHEFGHFIVAKRAGVLVREFAIGMGPKLLSWQRNGTAYVIRLLPVGGYVRMAGTDEEADLEPGQQLRLTFNDQQEIITMDTRVDQEQGGLVFRVDSFDLTDHLTLSGYGLDSEELVTYAVNHDAHIIQKNGLALQIAPRDTWVQSAKISKRLAINFAGPLMNFILALVLSIVYGLMQPGISLNEPIIGGVINGQPAQQAGIKAGDQVVKINNTKVANWKDIASQISQSQDQVLQVTVKRAQGQKTITVNPVVTKGDPTKQVHIGITPKVYTDLWSRLQFGISNTVNTAMQVLNALKYMITGHFSLNQLGGPVMMARVTSQASQTGIVTVIGLMAALSVNLGIMNLLPIPPLDGGKLLIDGIEGVWGRPLPPIVQNAIGLTGAGLLMLLMIAVTINDILR